jgi:hypothetical protein
MTPLTALMEENSLAPGKVSQKPSKTAVRFNRIHLNSTGPRTPYPPGRRTIPYEAGRTKIRTGKQRFFPVRQCLPGLRGSGNHLPTGFSTLAAMIVMRRMLPALGGAAFTGLGAHLAGLRVQVAAAHRHPSGEGAGVGTVAVEAHAPGHHLDVVLCQTGGLAVLAGSEAVQAGIDAGLQFRTDNHLHVHLILRGEGLSREVRVSGSCKRVSSLKMITMHALCSLKVRCRTGTVLA